METYAGEAFYKLLRVVIGGVALLLRPLAEARPGLQHERAVRVHLAHGFKQLHGLSLATPSRPPWNRVMPGWLAGFPI